jgi:ubiquinone/menaquinone biosynthesis C-methylase UbiE
LNRIADATDEWREIARLDDVHRNIVGDPPHAGSWTDEEFYATGASDWADFRRHWLHYWPPLGGTCVEIGCGAGRVTHALAADFDRVVALDVSPEMIERARVVVPANVEFRQVRGSEIPLPAGEADAVFSCHVLQHFEDYAVVRGSMHEARRVLRAGGTAMVHITISSYRRSWLWRAREELRLWLARRRLRRGVRPAVIRMRTYKHEDILRLLAEAGFTDCELRGFPVASNGYLHHFFLARAPTL